MGLSRQGWRSWVNCLVAAEQGSGSGLVPDSAREAEAPKTPYLGAEGWKRGADRQWPSGGQGGAINKESLLLKAGAQRRCRVGSRRAGDSVPGPGTRESVPGEGRTMLSRPPPPNGAGAAGPARPPSAPALTGEGGVSVQPVAQTRDWAPSALLLLLPPLSLATPLSKSRGSCPSPRVSSQQTLLQPRPVPGMLFYLPPGTPHSPGLSSGLTGCPPLCATSKGSIETHIT